MVVALLFWAVFTPARADEFDDLRLRWVAALNGGPGLNTADPDIADELADTASAAQSLWDSMDKSAGRTALWSDYNQLTTLSSHITGSYNNLRRLATAYATPGCSLAGNLSLRNDLFGALDWLYANYYNETKTEYYNWWDWQIGTPLALNDITALVYGDLSVAQRTNYMNAVNKFTPSPTLTGANLVWKATVVAVRGVIVKDSAKLVAARDSLGSVFAYVTSGDGFYTDGSFVQHTWHPYTGGYGSALLANLGPLVEMLNGSTWKITDSRLPNLYRWLHDSYEPVIYRGAMPDMLRGREIARSGSGDHGSGAGVVASILRIAQFAPPDDALAFKRMAKYWIQSDTSRDFLGNASLAVIPLAQQILADPAIVSRGELVGHFNFPKMDRVMHLRPGFGFGLSLSSTRIATYESINQENLKAWYTGEGMNYLYNGDLTQFNDNYWCTVNPYRMPGTTVDTGSRANASGQSTRSTQSWVGGARLDLYGVVGMQLAAWSNGLTGKKSWFLLDDEIVCLGSDIRSTSGRVIETIVENRRLAGTGTQTFTVNDSAMPATLGWSATMPAVSWAHLAGNVAGADIGYVFPQPAEVKGLREARTGTWNAINSRSGSTTSYTRNYLTMWLDHGVNPAGTTYAYAILPNQAATAVASYSAAPEFTIVENSASAQAVRENTLGITAANFWADAVYSTGGITSDRKASVILQDNGTELAVAVADPTQLNSGAIQVEIGTPMARTLAADPRVTVVQVSPTLKLSVNVNGGAGASFRATFTRAPAPNVAPLARDDAKRVAAGTPAIIPVLANDSDSDSGPAALAISALTAPAHGVAGIASSSVLYTAEAGFVGSDSFTYTLTDGEASSTATVNVQVGPGSVPVATLTASTWQDPNIPANVLDGDLATRWSAQGDGQWLACDLGTPHRIEAVALAFYGGTTRVATFDVQVSADGVNWVTLSNHTSNGMTDNLQTFAVAATWTRWLRILGHGNSQSTWNSITELKIHAVGNAPPLLTAASAETDEGLPVIVNLLENAADPDGGPGVLTLVGTGAAMHGTVEPISGGAQYTPATGFTGPDSFSYSVSDGGLTATGIVNVEVRNIRSFEGFRQDSFDPGQLVDPLISAPGADPDHDGIGNLLEYALMLDPWKPEPAPLALQPPGGSFRYTYTRRKLAIDLIYQPEVSNDLKVWDGSGTQVGQSVVSDTATAQTIEVSDLVPAAGGERRFHRLRVTLTP